jgi:hypothetical protein
MPTSAPQRSAPKPSAYGRPARARMTEVEPFAKFAPRVLGFAFLAGFARIVLPVLADLIAGVGFLIALVSALIGLVRIYTSGGVYVGAKRAWATLAVVGIMTAIAVPNFTRYRARALECGTFSNHVQELVAYSKGVQEANQLVKNQPWQVADNLKGHSGTLEKWSTDVQAQAASWSLLGEHASSISVEVGALSKKYVVLAEAIRAQDGPRMRSLSAEAAAAEKKLSEMFVKTGGYCPSGKVDGTTWENGFAAPPPLTEPETATADVQKGGALWFETIKKATEEQKKAAQELPKALNVAGIDSKEEIADRKAIVLAFRTANQKLIDLSTGPEAFIRKELEAKNVEPTKIEATLAAMRVDMDELTASAEIRKLDDKVAVHLLAALDVLGKNLGKWHVDGEGELNFQKAAVEKAYRKQMTAIEAIAEKQEALKRR